MRETKTPDQSFSASYTVTPEANYNEDVTVNKFKIIITKSTVPVTTGDEIEKIISKKVSKKIFQ